VRIVDISLPLGPDTPVYPGDPSVTIERLGEAGGAGSFALSRLSLGSHSGTHVDPPAHVIAGGATIDAIPLDACIGPVFVLDLTQESELIAAEALNRVPDNTARILLHTGGPRIGGVALSPEAAHAIVDRRVRLVGIDTLSVAPAASPREVHRILLAAGVVILEGLDLTAVPDGPATLLCLPLKISGGDGAPARAVLLYDE
jgi:arylformamidase